MNTVENVIRSILEGRRSKVLLGVYRCKVGFFSGLLTELKELT